MEGERKYEISKVQCVNETTNLLNKHGYILYNKLNQDFKRGK